MVDLILALAIGVAFFGGFKAGNKYATFDKLVEGARSWFRD